MKQVFKYGFFAVCGFLYLLNNSGCITDADLSGYPAVSFRNEVQPIIGGNCGQEGCHGQVNPEQSPLVTYEDIRFKVTPGDARNSDLYRFITGREEEIMPPPPASILNNEQIGKIYLWIEQGALDN